MYFMGSYLFWLIVLCVAVLIMVCTFTLHYKKKRSIAKVIAMSCLQKCELLNSLVEPFGYLYICQDDIFSSTLDPWQKEFGYIQLFDRAAAAMNMVFDCEPIYFDYHGRTWLIEFWKGQYGINTGGEIGVYHADGIVTEKDIPTTVFHAADPDEMLDLSMTLRFKNKCVSLSARHWWLTAFCMGVFTNPKDISMYIRINFFSLEMLDSFVRGVMKAGYSYKDFQICGSQFMMAFNSPRTPQHRNIFSRLYRRLVQCVNRLYCRLFLFVTRPFCSTVDRLLYLYFYLPFAFRHSSRMRRNKGCRNKKRRK